MAAKRNPGLDLVRATAISLVIAAHAAAFLSAVLGDSTIPSLMGYAGVDLFFALSGYLIGGIIIRYQSNGPPNQWLGRFLARRWVRTLPNYFLFLVVHLIYHQWHYGFMPPRLGLFPLFLQSFHDFLIGNGTGFFVESWSLCVEEWFYVLFPAALLLLSLASGSRTVSVRNVVWWFVAFGFIVRVVGVIWWTLPWQPDLNRPVLFRLDAIACGILIRSMHDQMPSLGKSRSLALFGAVLSFGSLLLLWHQGVHRPHDSLAVLSPLLIPLGFACLLPKLTTWSPSSGSLLADVGGHLSRWSYAAYLCNMLIMLILLDGFPNPSLPNALWLIAVFLLSTLLVSAAVYYGFEQKILNWRERRYPDPSPQDR